MMRFFHFPASFSDPQPSTCGAVRDWRAKGASIVLLGAALLVVPLAHAQPTRGLFASEAQDQARPGAELRRKDWRHTLDGQGRAGGGSPQRRKNGEEGRSNLQRNRGGGAQGACRDGSLRRKGRRCPTLARRGGPALGP